jgi:hypothetical protein
MSNFNLNWQRGYEEGLALGIAREQERIVKLLQQASISFKQYDLDAVATTYFLLRLIEADK